MLKRVKKFISINKVATSYVTIGFFILSATLFLIQKNSKITTLKKEVLLLNHLKFHTLELRYNLDLITPKTPQREALSTCLDSLTLSYRQFIQPYNSIIRDPENNPALERKEQVILYVNETVSELSNAVRHLIYKQNVSDSTIRFNEELILSENGEQKTLTIEKTKTDSYFDKSTLDQILKAKVLASNTTGKFNTLYNDFDHDLQEKIDLFEQVTILVALCLFLCLSIAYFILKKVYLVPLFDFNKYSGALLSGKYKLFNGRTSREFKTIVKTVNSLVDEINTTAAILTRFKIENIDSEKIEKEDFLGKKTPLPKALSSMFDSLSTIALVENERKWAVEGQAKFSNLLNKNINQLTDVLNAILPELVKYTGALQGAIFIDNNPEVSSEHKKMNLEALYAYDRRKYRKKTLELGEGLSGQVWQEGKHAIINNLPEEHSEIKSGLGEKQPRTLLIFPIIENEQIHGIIELAAFKKFPQYKIDFLANIIETLASTIASFRINQKTKDLLLDSQTLAKRMQEKDEETNQHLEALQAAKEEMEKSKILKENEIKSLRLQLEDCKANNERNEKKHNQDLAKLELKLLEASLNSPKTKELEEELQKEKETLDQTIKDFKETIKIKDLRIEKLRKKIQSQQ